MTVKAILSRKGNDVVTADPNATLAETVRVLAARRIGAVVVTGASGGMLASVGRGAAVLPNPILAIPQAAPAIMTTPVAAAKASFRPFECISRFPYGPPRSLLTQSCRKGGGS